VTYLSHTAPFQSNERIAPSNRGIDGQVEHGGNTYYIYSALGSTAGVANLQF
jgi:hypothetical protein